MERGNKALKVIDRLVGIPLLWLLGTLRVKKKRPVKFQRIAIVKGAAIGDTVLLSAIVQDLRTQLPEAEIVFFCGKTCLEVARLIPGIDQVVFIPTTKPLLAIRTLREFGRFDVVIDAGPWTRLEALFTYFTHGEYKVGFKSIGQHRHYAYDQCAEHSNQQHELENNRNLVRALGLKTNHLPVIRVPQINEQELLIKLGIQHPVWIFHAWSGGFKGHYKEWQPERWVAMATWLAEQGYQIAFSGAKSNWQQTDELVSACLEKGIPALNLSGQLSLAELLVLLQASSGLISVNTGILHLAAAVDTPVVALNGPVPTKRWGAVSSKAVNLEPKQGAVPYLHFGFEYPARPDDCMGNITVHDVQEAVLSLMLANA